MYKYILSYTFCVFISFLSMSASAQTWERVFDHPDTLGWASLYMGFDVKQTTDGGFIWIGETDLASGAIRHYSHLTKTDAQGNTQWAKILRWNGFGSVANDQVRSVLQTPDGGYLLAGSGFNPQFTTNNSLQLIKTNPLGDTLWTSHYQAYAFATHQAQRLHAVSTGGYILLGTAIGLNDFRTLLVRTDASGDTLWQKTYQVYEMAADMQETSDGGFVMAGERLSNAWVCKTDMNGDTLWSRTFSFSTDDHAYGIKELATGGYIVVGASSGFAGYSSLIFRLDANGNLVGSPIMGGSPPFSSGILTSINPTNDGNFIVAGSQEDFYSTNSYTGFYAKIDPTGNTIWSHALDSNRQGNNIYQTNDLGYILVGSAPDGAYLHRVDSLGLINSSATYGIEGYVFADTVQFNCLKETQEDGFANWIVAITGTFNGNLQTQYTSTDNNGYYFMDTEMGNYTVSISPPYTIWDACQDTFIVDVGAVEDTVQVDFGMQATHYCPVMAVDISTPYLERCSLATYTVNYCNYGLSPAFGSYVSVALDSFLVVNNTNQPFTIQGNELIFNLDTVAAGECGSFTIEVLVACLGNTTNNISGQTHCVEANIYPQLNCPFITGDNPNIEVDAECLGDSIEFIIRNVGISMPPSDIRGFYVAEDDLMMRTGNFNLQSNEDTTIMVAVSNGATYRLDTDPNYISNFYPLNASLDAPSVTVEGCGSSFASTSNDFSLGFVNIYPENDALPYTSIDCQENLGASVPNYKQGFPIGLGSEHYIQNNQAIEYHIRFQNSTPNAVQQVVVMDTLDPNLEVASLLLGTSSHPYTWEIIGGGILKFTFNNINLPSASTNLADSYGFVKFKISPKTDRAVETRIENTATIFLANDTTINSNTTWHTIDEDLQSKIDKMPSTQQQALVISAYPNPFSHSTQIQLSGQNFEQFELYLYDGLGRFIRQETGYNNQLELYKDQLNSGIYFFQLRYKGQSLGSGKLIIQE